MKVKSQPQFVLSFDTKSARLLAGLSLAVLRGSLIASFLFLSTYSRPDVLLRMEYGAGRVLICLGGLLNMPLVLLYGLLPSLRAFATQGLSSPHRSLLPTAHFLIVAVPVFVSIVASRRVLLLGLHTLTRTIDTVAALVRQPVLCVAVGSALRAFVFFLFFGLSVRYAFTPQFDFSWDTLSNHLLATSHASRPFLWLALAPSVPLLWLPGSDVAARSLYPSVTLLLANALLIAILAGVTQLLMTHLTSATRGHIQPRNSGV